jgi:AraC family transcriptional regulator
MFLPNGRYAKAIHFGARANLGDTVYAMYRDWLPESGEEPGDFPIIFGYHNFDNEVPESELVTEYLLLLK